MKICIYSLLYYPEVGATPNKLHGICKRLVSYGHEVTVHTFIPNYPSYKIYDGYKYRLCNKEWIDGVKVIQTCLTPPMKGKYFARIMNFFSYAISSIIFNFDILKKQDIFIFNSTPIFSVAPAIFLGKLSRAKIIMYACDLWPGIVKKLGYKKIGIVSYGIMYFLEKIGHNYSDLSIVVTPQAMEDIKTRYNNTDINIVSDGFDKSIFYPRTESNRIKYGYNESDFIIGFCGLHGWMHGLPNVIEAVAELNKYKDIKFMFIGDGPAKSSIVDKVKMYGLDNITFIDPVPYNEVPNIMSCFDVGLVSLASKMEYVVPAKTYDLLALGIPILISSGCEASDFVEQYNLGKIFNVNDSNDLKKSILELYYTRNNMTAMSDNCIRFSEKFDYDLIAKHFESICYALKEEQQTPAYYGL